MDSALRWDGRVRRWARALVVFSLVVSPLSVLATQAQEQAIASGVPDTEFSEAEALAAARKAGSEVLISSQLGERREVYATPDGNLHAVQHQRPVRTRRNGVWNTVDTTLKHQGDGSISPVAAIVDLAFTGGGAGPAVRMSRMGREMSLTWPKGLPAPRLNGDTATYPDVLPGVDLQLRAEADGYAEVLVVKTREAAGNPELQNLQFGLKTVGLQPQADPSGAMYFVDSATGGTVFQAPAAKMWDSGLTTQATAVTRSTKGAGSRRSAQVAKPLNPALAQDLKRGPREASKVGRVGVALSRGKLTLRPDRALLAAPDTAFPVYIDPQPYTADDAHRLMVSDHAGNDYDFTGTEGMGYCNPSWDSACRTTHKKRLFFKMPLTHYAGATIISAQFIAHETFAWNCNDGRLVQLWEATSFGSSSTWGTTSDNWVKQLTSRDVSYCNDSGVPVKFPSLADGNDSTPKSTVTKAVASYVAKGKSAIYFGLKALDESSMIAWKRFKGDADLSVIYNRKPRQPKKSALSMPESGSCGSKTNPVYTNRIPKLGVAKGSSGVSDPDGDKVRAQFGLSWDANDGAGWKQRWQSNLLTTVASGTPVLLDLSKTTSPTLTLPEDALIGWHVRGYDGVVNGSADYGPWSYQSNAGDCYFIYDTTIPDPPSVNSADYPEINPDDPDDPPGYGMVGQRGQFTISSADAGRFRLGLNATPSAAWEVAATTGAATVPVTPTLDGTNQLYVQAVSRAGQAAVNYRVYTFRVNPGVGPVGHWKLDEAAGTTELVDSTSRTDVTAHPAVVSGGMTLGRPGQIDTAASLNGTNGQASVGTPAVDTGPGKSFSVSAWARLPQSKPTSASIVAAQIGTNVPSFELYYSSGYDQWIFNRRASDGSNATVVRAKHATAKAQAGVWAHLVGVYDAGADKLRLYVNGQLAGETAYDPATEWKATGKWLIGASSYSPGTVGGYFAGDIDDMQVHDRPITADEVERLFTVKPVAVARWKLNAKSAATPATSADDFATSGHPVTLNGGADVSAVANVGIGALALNGTSAYAATSSPLVDTSQSFTVSMWAGTSSRPAKLATVFSLPGVTNSAVAVRYVPGADPTAEGFYELAVPASDDLNNTAVVRAAHSSWHSDSDWDLLTVVYEAPSRTITLYVNGQEEAATDVTAGSMLVGTSPFSPTTKLLLGTATDHGKLVDYWPGQIDDVWVFRGAPPADQVINLYNSNELDIDHPPI